MLFHFVEPMLGGDRLVPHVKLVYHVSPCHRSCTAAGISLQRLLSLERRTQTRSSCWLLSSLIRLVKMLSSAAYILLCPVISMFFIICDGKTVIGFGYQDQSGVMAGHKDGK